MSKNLDIKLHNNSKPSGLELNKVVETGMLLQLADGSIQACNRMAEQLLGYTASQMIGKTFDELTRQVLQADGSAFPPETYPPLVALRTGKPCLDVVVGFYQPNNQLIWLQFNSQPLFGANTDSLYAVITTFSEIVNNQKLPDEGNASQLQPRQGNTTKINGLGSKGNILEGIDDKQAELESLQQQRLQCMVDSAPIGIGFGRLSGEVLAINDAMLKIYGYSREEFLAPEFNWRACTPPEYAELDQQGMVQLQQYGSTSPIEKEIIRQDGKRVPVLLCATSLPSEVDEHVVFVIDLTERKQAEAALQDALQRLTFHIENSPVAVVEWDHEFRVSRWSREAERIFGWQAEEVLGRRLDDWQFVFEADLEAVAGVVTRLAEGTEQRNISHNRNYTKDGAIVHCEWYNSTLLDDSGKLRSVLSLALDVSDRIKLQVEREQLLERTQACQVEAETANRIKDEFLAVLSHELRSPLNPILGWAKLLQTGKLSEAKIAQGLTIIERNAKLQAELIEDLLDVSRILRGKLTLNVAPVDLVIAILAAIETIQLAAQAKSIQLVTLFAPNVGLVNGDSNRLQQIVWNLLSNSVKFTPPGGKVEVRLEQVGAVAQITVSDTGKGINPDFLPHIFEHFRQEDSSITRKFGGLGLGLAIVRYLVELHGGTIQAVSPGEGQGATFTVELPVIEESFGSRGNRGSRGDKGEEKLNLELRGLKVLVIDDDADTRELLVCMLKQAEVKVIAVESAIEVLPLLTKFQPDLILSDIGMPEMDGYMLMRQIRALPPEQGGQIPAIALTAYAGEYDQKQALASGFELHIPKPVEPEQLLRAISSLVEKVTN